MRAGRSVTRTRSDRDGRDGFCGTRRPVAGDLVLSDRKHAEQFVDLRLHERERTAWFDESNIADAPILYSALPVGKSLAHKGAMFDLVERHNMRRSLQIRHCALLRKARGAPCRQPARLQATQGKGRKRPNIVLSAFEREAARLCLPVCGSRFGRAMIEQLLREAAAIVIAGAKEQNAFHCVEIVSARSMSRRIAMCAGRPETYAQGYRKAKEQNAAEVQQKVIHALPPECRITSFRGPVASRR